MSTRHILQSQAPGNFTTGTYVVRALISGTWNYWTGAAWTTTFASAEFPTFGTGTEAGASTWTWEIDALIDPSDTDDGRIYMSGWESGVTPTIADPPTWSITDEFLTATSTVSAVSAVTASISDDNKPAHVDLECCAGESHDFEIILLNADGTPNDSAFGHDVTLIISTWDDVELFNETVTVGGADDNQLAFTVGPAHASSFAGERWKLAIWDEDSTMRIVEGTLLIEGAAQPTESSEPPAGDATILSVIISGSNGVIVNWSADVVVGLFDPGDFRITVGETDVGGEWVVNLTPSQWFLQSNEWTGELDDGDIWNYINGVSGTVTPQGGVIAAP